MSDPTFAFPAFKRRDNHSFKFEDLYTKLGFLGEGVYGSVFKAKRVSDGRIVAVKETISDAEGVLPTTLREIGDLLSNTAILSAISHHNILSLIAVKFDIFSHKVYQIMPVFELDLSTFIEECQMNHETIPEHQIKDIANQILQGLSYMHEKNFMHRDLKPANILMNVNQDGNPHVVIADYGLSTNTTYATRRLTPNQVTVLYRAPEILFDMEKYVCNTDIWSVGVIIAGSTSLILEMYRGGRHLFYSDTEQGLINEIFLKLGVPSENDALFFNSTFDFTAYETVTIDSIDTYVEMACTEGANLLSLMLKYTAEQRITSTAALKHPYFSSPTNEE